MSRHKAIQGIVVFVFALFLTPAYAQKGAGDTTGLARQAFKPVMATLSGTVVSADTEACEKTTGRGQVGTHFLLKTADNETLNIDLGWSEADVVKSLVKQLTRGTPVTAVAFRSEKLPAGRYIAKSVTVAGKTTVLRDDNLRPVWAGRVGRGRGPGKGL